MDITLGGRGQQQMLLVLAYLLSNKGSVLMIDEPDAHLEILRQAQIFTVLKEVAQKYDCQIIIVTHSEVVLNEANSVVFLVNGNAQEISDKKEHKYIKDALKSFGIENYYKAKLKPRILYIEGSTDLDILRTFAYKYNHQAYDILEGRVNYYYTQNDESSTNLINELEQTAGAYQPFKKHFQAIKKVVPELKAIAIFDNDNKIRQDEQQEDYGVIFWRRYEIENYFINPKVIFAYIRKELSSLYGESYIEDKLKIFQSIYENEFLLPIFNNNKKALAEFSALPENLQEVQFENFSSSKKVSTLLENTFSEFGLQTNSKILLSKGNYFRLIAHTESIPREMSEKLDLVKKYLSE